MYYDELAQVAKFDIIIICYSLTVLQLWELFIPVETRQLRWSYSNLDHLGGTVFSMEKALLASLM